MTAKLLTVAEVADRLACSTSQVYLLLNTGRLTPTDIGAGKGRRVHPDDLEAFIQARRGRRQPLQGYQLKHLKLA